MINEFKNNIHEKFPFLEGKKLLVTVSGGIDSVILTHLLHELDYQIAIAHVNFHLRGTDSDHDEEFVREMASKMKIPTYITHFNTKEYAAQHKLSTQEAARNLRYQWFEEIRKKYQFDYILTGHNLNDSLETFLINLARGTGLKGLTGINTINGKIIRPLSNFSRNEIEVFAFISNIKWREDQSNAETKYTRNKIRHQVIPVLQELNPNLLESFKQTLENLQGTEAIVVDRLKNVVDELEAKSQKTEDIEIAVLPIAITEQSSFKTQRSNSKTTNSKQQTRLKTKDQRPKTNKPKTFNIEELKKLSNLKAYIHELFFPYGFTNSKNIIDLLDAQSGKQLFSRTYRLVKDRKFLLLEKLKEKRKEKREKKQEFLIDENDSTFNIHHLPFKIEHFNIVFRQKMRSDKKIAQFDKDLLKFPLTVRKWQNGDYFYPMGMQGKKKLSKYFKDEKLSLIEKENIWLLLSDNEIVWVIGMRQDERFKITETTNNITKISVL